MSRLHNPHRDSYSLTLAWLDDDMPRVAALIGPYLLSGDELELVVALLSLVGLDEDQAVLRSQLEALALAGAGRA